MTQIWRRSYGLREWSKPTLAACGVVALLNCTRSSGTATKAKGPAAVRRFKQSGVLQESSIPLLLFFFHEHGSDTLAQSIRRMRIISSADCWMQSEAIGLKRGN